MKPTVLTKARLAEAAAQLAAKDSDLALILERYGPPPMWQRQPGFATLIHIILEQQVSLAAAASMFARLKQHIDPLDPERILQLGEVHLRMLGLTRQKTGYCLHLAETIATNRLKLETLSRLDDDMVRTALMEVKGIGSWSAEVYLLMVLRRPDIWPASDLALATAAFKVKRLKQRPTPEQLIKLAESWRPYRSVAARMLWQSYLAERGKLEGQPTLKSSKVKKS
jgi:DNA-3-methyladenine glycosylase II